MTDRRTNIDTTEFAHCASSRDNDPPFRFLELSGEHLGVRIEEIAPGATSSHHHYHTAEEEHVLILSGEGTLHLGEAQHTLKTGDHIWFPAGETVAHHIENTSEAPIRMLVFGEREQEDVVVYPESAIMMVKTATGVRTVAYLDEG
ncbi:MAG: cupin domain-containing protein [Pseudomonadota bacterium]